MARSDHGSTRCLNCGGHIRLTSSKRLWWIDRKGWICSKTCRKQYEIRTNGQEANNKEADADPAKQLVRSGFKPN